MLFSVCVALASRMWHLGGRQHGTHSHSEQRRRERTERPPSYLLSCSVATLQRYTKPSRVEEEGPGCLAAIILAARWGGRVSK